MNQRYHRLMLMAAVLGFLFLIAGPGAAAEEAAASWRSTYDVIMRWVNFLILAGILVKFGRAPIKNFLSGQKKQIESDIKALEDQKQAAEQKVQEARRMLDESQQRFVSVTERIVAQGERKRDEIIADARTESQNLLASAKAKIDNQFIKARDRLRAELVDTAMQRVLEQLPQQIQKEDNQRFFQQYVQSISAK